MQILTHHLQKQGLATKEKRLITVMSKMAFRDLISVSETSERFFKGTSTADAPVCFGWEFWRSCKDLPRFWAIHATFVIYIIWWVFTHSLCKLFVRESLGRSDLSLLINTTCSLLIYSLLKTTGCEGNMSSESRSLVCSFVCTDHLHQTH